MNILKFILNRNIVHYNFKDLILENHNIIYVLVR